MVCISINRISVTIIAANEHGISAVTNIFGVTRNTITSWIKKFKENPDRILKIGAVRGKKTKFDRV